MASQVGMANRALTKLGSARITSLDEDSKSAAVLNSMYEDVLDVCLSEHIWAFAKARTELATLSTPPAFGFAGQFRLPTDYLRMLQVGQFVIYPKMDTRGLYSVEGGNILTDLPAPLRLRYIRRVTDPNAMHPLFREVFACRLAAESCEAITQSSTKKQAAWAEHDRAIAQAIRVNAAERPSQPIADDSWIESRQGAREWGASPIIRS